LSPTAQGEEDQEGRRQKEKQKNRSIKKQNASPEKEYLCHAFQIEGFYNSAELEKEFPT